MPTRPPKKADDDEGALRSYLLLILVLAGMVLMAAASRFDPSKSIFNPDDMTSANSAPYGRVR